MSSGHEEYKYILGNWSVWIYDLMFKIVTKNSKVIVCHERLFDKDKSFLVDPSRLNEVWMSNHTIPKKDIPKLLYVGRINPEKGIENFINIFNKLKINAELSIVGESRKKNSFLINKNIKLLGYASEEKDLVNIYDEHNITILPSYTEAYPYVIEESLSRRRPVIIFQDIDYVKKNKFGIFVSKRDVDSVTKTINHILSNYSNIQKDIEKNKLPNITAILGQESLIEKIQFHLEEIEKLASNLGINDIFRNKKFIEILAAQKLNLQRNIN